MPNSTVYIGVLIIVLAWRHLPHIWLDTPPINSERDYQGWFIVGSWALAHFLGISGLVSSQPDAITLIGILLIVVGAALGRFAIVELNLSDAYSFNIAAPPGARLVTTGPYSFVRHPVRIGIALETFGAIVLAKSLLAFIIFGPLVALLVARSRQEDSLLKQRFGTDAERYIRKVPAANPLRFFKH